MAATVRIKIDRAKLDQIMKAAKENVPTWVISDGVEYGIYQEMGTTRFAGRPFLVPAFEKGTGEIERDLGQAVERGVSLGDVMRKTAFDVQNLAQTIITEKHIIETGNLRDSIKAKPE